MGDGGRFPAMGVCVCVCVCGGGGGKFHSRQISWGWWWKFLWLVRGGRDFLEADQVAHIRGGWAGEGREGAVCTS